MPRRRGPLGGKSPCYKRHRIGHGTTIAPLIALPVVHVPDSDSRTVTHGVIEENVEHVSGEPEMSRHNKLKLAEVEQWRAIRHQLQLAACDSAIPALDTCILCLNAAAILLRCDDCGINYSGCEDCVTKDHEHRPMHFLEVWKGGMFQPYRSKCMPILSRLDHRSDCKSLRCRKITIINDKGYELDALCEFCACEAPPITLRRYGLWAATPTEPRCAFTVNFLQWAEALMVTSHVSLRGFIEAARFRNTLGQREMSSAYRLLATETFAEFRHHMFKMRSLIDICPSAEVELRCPACPRNTEDQLPLIMSLDGNFGLVHKRSSGQSFEEPLHGDRVFVSDSVVRDYMKGYTKQGKDDDVECSSFRAHMLSASQKAKLDVTGVFGSMCKHEIPYRLLNMEHGERFGYAVLMLEELTRRYGQITEKFLLYDVACSLERHLVHQGKTALLDSFRMAVPIFHCYGHEASCQMTFSPRRVERMGRVDGEALERFWSFLRHFGPITKEMTPSHRIDLLSDGCIYYASRKIDSIEITIVQRYATANQEVQAASEELQKVSTETGFAWTDACVSKWLEVDQGNIKARRQKRRTKPTNKPWEEQYVIDLLKLHTVQSIPATGSAVNDLIESQSTLLALQLKLKATEVQHKIDRWLKTDEVFRLHWRNSEMGRRARQLRQLLDLARERLFLLEVKRRQSVGQKLAKRVGDQISRCSSKIRKLVQVYNASSTQFDAERGNVACTLPSVVVEHDAFNPSHVMYQSIQLDVTTEMVSEPPYWIRSKVVDLLARRQRALEETQYCTVEMRQAFSYFKSLHCQLKATLECDCNTDATLVTLSAGQRALLQRKLLRVERRCIALQTMFRNHIPIDPIDTYFITDSELQQHTYSDEVDEVLPTDLDFRDSDSSYDDSLD